METNSRVWYYSLTGSVLTGHILPCMFKKKLNLNVDGIEQNLIQTTFAGDILELASLLSSLFIWKYLDMAEIPHPSPSQLGRGSSS